MSEDNFMELLVGLTTSHLEDMHGAGAAEEDANYLAECSARFIVSKMADLERDIAENPHLAPRLIAALISVSATIAAQMARMLRDEVARKATEGGKYVG